MTPLSAQQVNFGTHAEGYELHVGPQSDMLDFGDRVSGEGTVQIQLTDDEVVPIIIEGVAYLDVTVTLTPPNFLWLEGYDGDDEDKRMLVSIQMAYYNKGQIDDPYAAKDYATIEDVGNIATFRIRRRPGGPPGPPPTPPHAGYTPPTAEAYLFIYGDLEVGNVNAGTYSGQITIHVEYSTYEPQ